MTTMLKGKLYIPICNGKNIVPSDEVRISINGMSRKVHRNDSFDGTVKNPPRAIPVKMKLNPI